jgi:hypothetical protein
MAVYVLPQSRVFQLVELATVVNDFRAHAFVFGGHAALFRYTEPDEKPLTYVGQFDDQGQLIDGDYVNPFNWPNKPAASVIDLDYTKVYVENALLKYATDDTEDAYRAGPNKLQLTKILQSGNGYNASGDFGEREVRVGDVVRVKSSVFDFDMCSFVKAIETQFSAPDVDDVYSADTNFATNAGSQSFTAGDDNTDDVILDAIGTGYGDYENGILSETFFLEVTQASTGGDLDTARFRITSASGTVSAENVAPDSGGVLVVGKGLTVTFAPDGGTNLHLGETWTVVVEQIWDAPSLSANGYTGSVDRTYIVRVVRGGYLLGGDPALVKITTSQGTDSAGPFPISNVPFPIGNYGIMGSFDEDYVAKGDYYIVEAIGPKPQEKNILVLGHDLPPNVTTSQQDIQVEFFIRTSGELAKINPSDPLRANWTQSQSQVRLSVDAAILEPSWTVAGDPTPLQITSVPCDSYNRVHVHYRAWLSTLANEIGSIALVNDLNLLISGPLTPDNPLKFGLFKALSNNNRQAVRYCAVTDPNNLESWLTPLSLSEERSDVYNFVPLTYSRQVYDLVEAHVDGMSNEDMNRWRAAIFSLRTNKTKVLGDETLSSDQEVLLATTAVDSGTGLNSILSITSGNFSLDDAGVRAGDVVRYEYSQDPLGRPTYSEYIIDEVLSVSSVRLATGTPDAEVVPIKCEIWRNQTKNEQSQDIAQQASWDNERVVAVWPDEAGSAGVRFEGYHLAAALAGLISGVAPHQGLTNVSLNGVDDIDPDYFSRTQLDHMAVNGVWIVSKDRTSGVVYNRHAITTAAYELLNLREEMCRRNRDLISYRVQSRFAPYIGKTNATPSILDILEAEMLAEIQYLRRAFFSPTLGGQIIDGEITDLRISPVFRDRVVLECRIQQPAPLNNIDSYLTFFI